MIVMRNESYQKMSPGFLGGSQHAVMRMTAPRERTSNEIYPYFWRLASGEVISPVVRDMQYTSNVQHTQNQNSHSHGRRVGRELVSAGGVVTDIEIGRWTRWDVISSIMVSDSVL